MANYYSVPPDTREKEKLLGGWLTLAQGAWLLLGFVCGFIVFIILMKLIGIIVGAVFGVAVFVAIGAPFAFYKKHEMSLFRYLYLSNLDKRKNKHLPNIR